MQQVDNDGETSSKLPVVNGIPQGYVLAFPLFLAFINDLPAGVSVQIDQSGTSPTVKLYRMTWINYHNGSNNGACNSTFPNVTLYLSHDLKHISNTTTS